MTQSAALATLETVATTLPALIDRAVNALAGARTAAEVLEARELAGVAYDIAKRTARLAKAKQAHDDVIAAALRAQGDAMKIQSEAAHRLADEYDAAQERGEVARLGSNQHAEGVPNGNTLPVAAELGLTRKQIHEARIIRDAEEVDPGVVSRTVDEAVAAGKEPSKAKVRRAVLKVVRPALDGGATEAQPPLGSPEQQRTRFLNIAWDAEHRPSEFDFASMTNFSELADAAERVSNAWATAARELRRLVAP